MQQEILQRRRVPSGEGTGTGTGGGAAYSFVACLSHLTIDHASLSRRSTVPTPTPNRDTSNIWALITLLPCITYKLCAYPIPVLFRRLRPPSISPRIAIVFSLLSIVCQTLSRCHIRIISSISSSNASRCSLHIAHFSTIQ